MKSAQLPTENSTEVQAAVLNALPAHVALIDPHGVITSVNDAWRRFGDRNNSYSPGHEVGVNYLTVCDNAQDSGATFAHRAAAGIRGVLGGIAPRFLLEYPCDSPTRQRWFLLSVTPIGDGQMDGAVTMHIDITERRQAEADLRDSESRFRQIAENIGDVFFLRDVAGERVHYVSPAYQDIWGKSCESLYAHPGSWLESIHPDDRASAASHIHGGIASGTFEFEYRIIRPDGSIRFIESRGFPVRDAAGTVTRIVGVAKDVTRQRTAALELVASELRFSDMLSNVALAAVMLDREGCITYCNEHLLTLTDWTLPEVLGRNWFDAFVPATSDQPQRVFDSLIADRPGARHWENEIVTRSGARRLMRWSNSVLRSGAGDVTGTASIGEDITEQRQDEIRIKHLNRVYAMLSRINALVIRVNNHEELFREACRIAVEAGGFLMSMIVAIDQQTGKLTPIASMGKDANLMDSVGRLLESDSLSRDTMVARAIRSRKAVLSNDSHNDSAVLLGRRYADAGVRSLAALPLVVSDVAIGALALYSNEAQFFLDEEMDLLTELCNDIAFAVDHVDKGAKLTYLALYDPLTGLANQSLFIDRLRERLLSAAAAGQMKSVSVFDIDRFESISSAFGRNAGDELLGRVAERLTRTAGGDASRFARLGNDRFAIVSPPLESVDEARRYLEQRVESVFHDPFRVADNDVRIFVKVGVAMFPDDGSDADPLLRSAEAALKRAKLSGARHLFFNQEMTAHIAERLALENRLRHALDHGEFVLHYQPKVNLVSGKVTSAEALIRWNDPQTRLVPPMQFIPILEETGLIHEVGRWALGKAVSDYLRWLDAGLTAVRIAVNVSPLQLRNRTFTTELKQLLIADARSAAGLEIEITEGVVMEDIDHSIEVLGAIRAMGVTVAVDDFGTGFSSLGYVARLPIDSLKIDQSFVAEMMNGASGLSLVSTIIALGHSLKLKVVAEGVETEAQSQLLRSLRCDEMQGYLFSHPVSVDVFESKFLALAPTT
jgi:diguanylate cyclase (GGDEF)-like protein/PAS domain S-box-containing protein